MPDIDLLIILASLYDISIGELLECERRESVSDAPPPVEKSESEPSPTEEESRILLKKVNDYSRTQSVRFAARFLATVIFSCIALALTAFVGKESADQVKGGLLVVIVPVFAYALYTLGTAVSPSKSRYATLNKIDIGSLVLALNAIITHLVFFPNGEYHNYGLMGGYFAIILVFLVFFSVRLLIKIIKVIFRFAKYRFFNKD